MSKTAKPKAIKITFNGETAITVTTDKNKRLTGPSVRVESALSDAEAKTTLALALAVLADGMYDDEITIDIADPSKIFAAANPN